MSGSVQVTLGATYTPNMWDLRKRVSAARDAGEPLVFLTLTAPITSESVEVAIESGSLYLIGVRPAGGKWLEFAPDPERSQPASGGEVRPQLPGSRWIMAGSKKALSSYRGLQLGWNISVKPGATGQVSYDRDPATLLRFFRLWDGSISGFHVRLHLWVLIFVVAEALRFRPIENACARWIRPIGTAPEPLTFTKEMLDLVQNWHALAEANDSRVWTWPPEMPDLIVT